jgi:hypothetical protein
MGGLCFHRRDQLPGHLGYYSGRSQRGVPGAATRRPGRPDGLGAPQGLAGRVGLAPFVLAVANQAAMVALGRPGAGEELLSRHGFADVRRVAVPFVWEFADPDCFARALSSTGPAYEAIQHVGEQVFLEAAADGARVRDGLPLRAEINVVGTRGGSVKSVRCRQSCQIRAHLGVVANVGPDHCVQPRFVRAFPQAR